MEDANFFTFEMIITFKQSHGQMGWGQRQAEDMGALLMSLCNLNAIGITRTLFHDLCGPLVLRGGKTYSKFPLFVPTVDIVIVNALRCNYST